MGELARLSVRGAVGLKGVDRGLGTYVWTTEKKLCWHWSVVSLSNLSLEPGDLMGPSGLLWCGNVDR